MNEFEYLRSESAVWLMKAMLCSPMQWQIASTASESSFLHCLNTSKHTSCRNTKYHLLNKVIVELAILKIACLVLCNFLLFFLGFAFQTFDLVHECGFLDPTVTLGYRVVISANFNVFNKFFFQSPTLIMVLFVFSLNIDNCKCLVCTQDTYMIISLKICNIALILNYLNILKCHQYLAPKKL